MMVNSLLWISLIYINHQYEFERPTGGFHRLFPLKNNIEYYSKFIENPGEENLALWKKMTSNSGKKKK